MTLVLALPVVAWGGSSPYVVDTDGDGVADQVDNCPAVVNAAQISPTANRAETLNIGAAGINCSTVTNLLDPADTKNRLSGSGAAQTLKVTSGAWEAKILLCQ